MLLRSGDNTAPADTVRKVALNSLSVSFMPYDRGVKTQGSYAKALLAFTQAPIHLTEYGLQNTRGLCEYISDVAQGKAPDNVVGARSVRYFMALGIMSQVIDRVLDSSYTDDLIHQFGPFKWLADVFSGHPRKNEEPFQNVGGIAADAANAVYELGLSKEAAVKFAAPDSLLRLRESTNQHGKIRPEYGKRGSEQFWRNNLGAPIDSIAEKQADKQEKAATLKQRKAQRDFDKKIF